MTRPVDGKSAVSPWLVCRQPRPQAALRLYCFPHSGGSPGEFLRWANELAPAEIHGVQLPGRGSHVRAAPLDTMPEVVARLLDSVTFRSPYAFFGHSLGGLLAYETARRLEAAGHPGPEFILVSACAPPHHPRDDGLRHLPDEDLLAAIDERYGGGVPLTLLQDRTVHALLMAVFRADVCVSETYRHMHGPVLRSPLHVVGGSLDMPRELLAQWASYTTGHFQLTLLPGGHFYYREPDRRSALLRLLTALCDSKVV
ncbi:alpha/beta fold hydrolase [Streptomyces sp. NPDC004232]|uniref:thioesterase II family protein n=1 Tax=unclassified Streptomyces TaxID=2593676 RepID=UPI001D3D3F47|nr:alpha/beta fold hydrolase [Streptomyces sp. tea 10]